MALLDMPNSCPSQHDNFLGLISILTQMSSRLCFVKAHFSPETGTFPPFINGMH
jgi:hypothetical protein